MAIPITNGLRLLVAGISWRSGCCAASRFFGASTVGVTGSSVERRDSGCAGTLHVDELSGLICCTGMLAATGFPHVPQNLAFSLICFPQCLQNIGHPV